MFSESVCGGGPSVGASELEEEGVGEGMVEG